MNAEPPVSTPSSVATLASGTERFHALDAVRAFALLLGVFFHAAESFEPGVEAYWAIADSSSSVMLGTIRHACHSFRLEIFFLIAGFFAHLVYQRRGQAAFIRDRIGRILVPLLIGWFILYPLLVYLWLLGASVGGRLEQFGVPPEMTQTPPALLLLGFLVSLQFLKKFDLTHLWFLHQLLVLYALFVPLRALWHRWLDPNSQRLGQFDRCVAMLCASRWKVLILALVTAPLLLTMDSRGVDTPKESLLPHLPTTLLFGFQFGLGWLLHRQTRLLDEFARDWRVPMLVGILMVWPTKFGLDWLRGHGLPPDSALWVRGLYTLLYALMMWGFVLGFLGAFIRFRKTPSNAWRYIADSSYWIYLVHLPLVVWLQIQVARWPQPWIVKYPLIVVVALPLLFLSYHYLVRSTFIGAQLNGRRR